MSRGIPCPVCKCLESTVQATRENGDDGGVEIVRYRKCFHCGYRYRTNEAAEETGQNQVERPKNRRKSSKKATSGTKNESTVADLV